MAQQYTPKATEPAIELASDKEGDNVAVFPLHSESISHPSSSSPVQKCSPAKAHESNGEEPPVRKLKRSTRACDNCRHSKVRCDGLYPCKRCIRIGFTCEYLRVPGARGRAPRYRPAATQCKDIEPRQPKRTDSKVGHNPTPSLSTLNLPLKAPSTSDLSVYPQSQITSIPAQNRPNHINSLLYQHNLPNPPQYDGIKDQGHEIIGHIPGEQRSFTPFSNPPWMGIIPTIMSAHPGPDSFKETMDFSSERCQISSSSAMECGLLEPSTLQNWLPASQEKTSWAGGEFWYPVLNPLIEHLRPIISISDACNLLEYYFTEPTDSTILAQPHSPYVLAQIFRKRTFLNFRTYRPTSPALLCSMLLIALQTSNLEGLTVTLSSKAMSSAKLQELCLKILGPLNPSEDSNDGEKLYESSFSSNSDLDTVITYLHMATIISAGDSKGESIKWWRAAVYLAMSLRLNRELEPKYVEGPLPSNMEETTKEERRRTWWLLYICDRHIALCYNLPLLIPQTGDGFVFSASVPRKYGPCYKMTSTTIFGFFLPLMRILGETINLHQNRNELSLDPVTEEVAMGSILEMLSIFEQSLYDISKNMGSHPSLIAQIVLAYSSHLMHVLYVLVYGKWDPILMLDNSDSWIGSPRFNASVKHTVAAMEAVSEILALDPSLDYMPYLWGIYLLHGSFLLILFVEKMELSDIDNERVVAACMTSLRAHEVIVTTLNTEYQRNFRRVLRRALQKLRSPNPFGVARRDVNLREPLLLYRWSCDGKGLAL